MKNFLGEVDVLNNLLSMLSDAYIIFAMALAVVGIVISCIAGKVAKVVRKKKQIPANDSIKVVMKIIGIVLILIGLIIVSVSSISTIIKK